MRRLEALARHPLAIAGALITTTSAVVFIALVIAMFAGLLDNPYAGLVVFVALPAVFVTGLLLIPAGLWLQQRKLQRHPEAAADWPVFDFRQPVVRRRALIFTALTAVNIIIILVAGYGSLHWMESPAFCGQTCHTPMQPQFTAWRDGPHARIACVRCHIGEGAKALVHAKLAGVRQLAHVATGLYPTPIPPGTRMPPGAQAETCLGCHQPSRVTGDHTRVFPEYGDDEGNTEATTVLQLYFGSPTSNGHSIHWHADPAVHIEYVATGEDRQTIIYVKATDAKGQVKDIPCRGHHRSSDRQWRSPNHGLHRLPQFGRTSDLPRRRAGRGPRHRRRAGQPEASVCAERRGSSSDGPYDSQDAALNAIDRGWRDFYKSQAGADQQAAARAAAAIQDAYRRNVFPTMKVTWGSYPYNAGHIALPGCVRCHDDEHKAKDGSAISGDCEYRHKQIENAGGQRP